MTGGPTPLADLIVDTRDGEWGAGQETPGHVLCEVIRGTDFAQLHSPGIELPRRWVPEHLVVKKALLAGDILLETAGGTATQSTGRTALVTAAFLARRSGTPVLCSSFARHLRVDRTKVCPEYLYFVLQALYRAGYMAVFNLQHTGISRFQFTSFRNKTALRLHPGPAQIAIAGMLTAYDELIANNQRRIALLETMADEIYREWFVRMRTRSQVDELRERQVLRGLVAEYFGGDWGEDTPSPKFSSAVRVIRGTDFEDVAIGDVSRVPLRYVTETSLRSRKLHPGDIVMENSVNHQTRTAGRSILITEALLGLFDGDVICASFCKLIRPKHQAHSRLLWLNLRLLFAQGLFESYQNVATNGIANLQIERLLSRHHVPRFGEGEQSVLDSFDTSLLAASINRLRTIKEAVLPRLISGKLDVEHVDIRLPPSMQALTPA